MKDTFYPDFHLFDGEGGGEASGGETASTPESKQDVREVQYGRSAGEGQAHSQVGSDRSAAEGSSPEAEFAELIGKGGRYHDIYGQHVSQAIQQRFKNQADLSGQIDQIAEDLSPLFSNYGLSAGDFEGLKNAIANDDTFYQAGAEKAGMTVDQYRQMLKYKADSERLAQMNEAYQKEQQRQAMYGQWEAEAAQLQQAFPGFDLGLEIQHNEDFARLISNGVGVRQAFMTTHMDEIMNGQSAYAQKTATQDVLSSIQKSASRPAEGALSHAPAVMRKSDPSKLTDKDLDEINRRVANGEVISF